MIACFIRILDDCRYVHLTSYWQTKIEKKHITTLVLFAWSHWQKNNLRGYTCYFRAVLWVVFDDIMCMFVYSANAVSRLIGALLFYKQKKTPTRKRTMPFTTILALAYMTAVAIGWGFPSHSPFNTHLAANVRKNKHNLTAFLKLISYCFSQRAPPE